MSGIDLVVLVAYLAAMAGMGFWFMRRNKSADAYFKAGGRLPWWVVSLSIYATMFSSITFMSVPAMAFSGNMTYLVISFGVPILSVVTVRWYLPFFRWLNLTSAYEYLEVRFNLPCRLFASAAFILFMVARSRTGTGPRPSSLNLGRILSEPCEISRFAQDSSKVSFRFLCHTVFRSGGRDGSAGGSRPGSVRRASERNGQMARKNRVSVYDGIYHVTARIAHRAMLLAEGEVKDQIMEWISSVAAFSGVEVWAFCIMDNHLHLFLHVPPVPERYWLDPNDEPAAYAFGMRPPECREPLWGGDSPRPRTAAEADRPDGDSPSRPIGDLPSRPMGDGPSRPGLGFMLEDEEMLARLAALYGPERGSSRRLRSIAGKDQVDCSRMFRGSHG